MAAKTLAGAGLAVILAAGLIFWSFNYFLVGGFYWQHAELEPPLRFALLSAAGAGFVFVLRGLSYWVFGHPAERQAPRIFPEMHLQQVMTSPRHRPSLLISELPNFGMIWGFVFLVLLFIFMMVQQPGPSHGVLVNFSMRNVAALPKSPWVETVGIYIDGDGRFYVNGTIVKREALRDALQTKLDGQMVWTVYFEADSDCKFEDAVYAMSVIRDLNAKLVWITPKVREELNRGKSSAE